jgi:phosphoglycerate dehydrogenase-like enzyme
MTRLRVAVLDDYQSAAAAMADWSRLDADVEFVHDVIPPSELGTRLADFDVIVAMRERTRFPADVLAGLPRLRLLVTTGMRNAAIDVAAAHELGIVVSGTRSNQSGTLELTWALILGLVRRVADDDRQLREGGWQSRVSGDLNGSVLGIVGLGKLGSRVAEVGRAFGMRVVAWSPHLTAERAAEASVQRVDKSELFEIADVVSLHLVLSDRTRGIVGEPELRAMKPSAFLVNSARAALVQEDALRAALEGGWIGGAGLDVFEQEPLPADAWQRTAPRTLLSPHMGYVAEANFRLSYGDAVQDIEAFVAGTPLRMLDQPGGVT